MHWFPIFFQINFLTYCFLQKFIPYACRLSITWLWPKKKWLQVWSNDSWSLWLFLRSICPLQRNCFLYCSCTSSLCAIFSETSDNILVFNHKYHGVFHWGSLLREEASLFCDELQTVLKCSDISLHTTDCPITSLSWLLLVSI